MEVMLREEGMEVCRRRRGCGTRGLGGVFVSECGSVEVRTRQGGYRPRRREAAGTRGVSGASP